MSPQQFELLIATLEKLSNRLGTYTITGAADWPILAPVAGLMVAMIAYMWHDLKATLKTDRDTWRVTMAEQRLELERVETRCRIEAEKGDDKIWTAIRHCQEDCCKKELMR